MLAEKVQRGISILSPIICHDLKKNTVELMGGFSKARIVCVWHEQQPYEASEQLKLL